MHKEVPVPYKVKGIQLEQTGCLSTKVKYFKQDIVRETPALQLPQGAKGRTLSAYFLAQEGKLSDRGKASGKSPFFLIALNQGFVWLILDLGGQSRGSTNQISVRSTVGVPLRPPSFPPRCHPSRHAAAAIPTAATIPATAAIPTAATSPLFLPLCCSRHRVTVVVAVGVARHVGVALRRLLRAVWRWCCSGSCAPCRGGIAAVLVCCKGWWWLVCGDGLEVAATDLCAARWRRRWRWGLSPAAAGGVGAKGQGVVVAFVPPQDFLHEEDARACSTMTQEQWVDVLTKEIDDRAGFTISEVGSLLPSYHLSTKKVRLKTDVVNPTKAVRVGTIPAAAMVALWLLQLGSYRGIGVACSGVSSAHCRCCCRMQRGVVDSLSSLLSLQPLDSWIPGSYALKARAGKDGIEMRSSDGIILRVPATGPNFLCYDPAGSLVRGDAESVVSRHEAGGSAVKPTEAGSWVPMKRGLPCLGRKE
ncbi:hypothetical protein EDB84DRAFT_1440691 [Lactarius hengduanensis]|nr:hypothetical protein EDB84DRAFT_1440691 [Lactarius hengduanensis]